VTRACDAKKVFLRTQVPYQRRLRKIWRGKVRWLVSGNVVVFPGASSPPAFFHHKILTRPSRGWGAGGFDISFRKAREIDLIESDGRLAMFGGWFTSSSANDNNFLRVGNTFTSRRLSDNTLMTPKIRIAPSCASSPGATPGCGLPIRRHSSTGPQERRGSNINLSPPTVRMCVVYRVSHT